MASGWPVWRVHWAIVVAWGFLAGMARAEDRLNQAAGQAASSAKPFAIAIHGGALGNTDRLDAKRRAAGEAVLKQALELGVAILDNGGTSLDAVEQVIRLLEDDPLFNAGRGAVMNAAGGHELDASIMEGAAKRCGAVAGVRTVKNPISLARLVMTKTRHVLLAGEGAEQFAGEMQVDRVDNQYFATPERLEEWKKARAKSGAAAEHKGTVGCVALDRHGNLAAGTSTGGLTNKMYGRIGDSPIIGAGTYADNATCAVSCTGTGEEFIRYAVAYDISAQMAYRKLSLDAAVQDVLKNKLQPGIGGLIAVDYSGNVVMRYNTAGMARAARDKQGRQEIVLGP